MGYLKNLGLAIMGIDPTSNGFAIGGASYRDNDPEFFIENGAINLYELENAYQYIIAYKLATPLASMLNMKAKAYAGGKVEVLNSNTDNFVRGQYKEWETLFNKPNPQQSGRQFFNQLYLYRKLNGWTLVKKEYPLGFKDRPSKLWNIPFWWITFDNIYRSAAYGYDYKDALSHAWINYPDGRRVKVNPNEFILITDDVPVYDEYTGLPKSVISLMQNPLSLLLSEYEAEITMIQKRGGIGMIASDAEDAIGAMGMKPSEEKDLHNAFQKMFGLSRAQNPIIVTRSKVKWHPMSFPTKDLLLHESKVAAVKDIADMVGIPFELTAYSDRKNLANVNSFDRKFISDYVIPDAISIDEQLVMGMNTTDPIRLNHYYGDAPALQASKQEQAEYIKATAEAYSIMLRDGVITPNEWRTAAEMDTVSEPKFSEYGKEEPAEGRPGETTGQQEAESQATEQ